MRRIRVIPTLLVRDGGLVKTTRFTRARYVGDPINTVRIFNDKEVDELMVLDIDATRERRPPQMKLVRDLAGECFMPFAFGGGITGIDEIAAILRAGAEKVVLNSALVTAPDLITAASRRFGSQSIVVSIDVRRTLFGGTRVYTHGGTRQARFDAVAAAQRAADLGAGEILLTAIDREGTMDGYDIPLIRSVTSAVSIPVVAVGGASTVEDLGKAVRDGGAAAVAAGSMFVFQGVHRAVLVNFPSPDVLARHVFMPADSLKPSGVAR